MKTEKLSVAVADLPVELLGRMADVLRLLANPARLRIIAILADQGGAPVHGVTERVGLPQAATSQHLNQMKRVGLIRSERRGKEVWYSVADPRALTILNCIQNSTDHACKGRTT